MALVPQGAGLLPQVKTASAAAETSRTWRIDFARGRVMGMTDGKEAMEQAIYMLLSTERFAHLIFSRNYGVELGRVTGRDGGELESEVRRVITEALLADGRITAVRDFVFTRPERRTLAVSFVAETTVGEISMTREVSV